jgi:adenylate cyclase class 2
VEIKLPIDDVAEAVRRIEGLGAELVTPRHFEDNRVFDTRSGALGLAGKLLRLREANGRAVVTSKAPVVAAAESRYKERHEMEIVVSDASAVVAILENVGFRVRWRYQKYRREYALSGAVVVLDETPHGSFWEIEGDPSAIDTIAANLGYGTSDYVTASYWELHRRECERRGVPPGDMVFGAGAARVGLE